MNDWWNEPPEIPDLPECCGDEMIDFPDGVCLCETCGKREAPYNDIDPSWEDCPPMEDDPPDEDDYSGPKLCQHGNEWHACDACDHLGDLAYDAARESRYR